MSDGTYRGSNSNMRAERLQLSINESLAYLKAHLGDREAALSAQLEDAARVLRDERAAHATRVSELVDTGRRMESLLRTAVDENKTLTNRLTELTTVTDSLDATGGSATAPFHWTADTPTGGGDDVLSQLSVRLLRSRGEGEASDLELVLHHVEPVLLAMVAASATGATPWCLANRNNSSGLVELIDLGEGGATTWRRIVARPTVQIAVKLNYHSCRLTARTSLGADLWWAHAVFTECCSAPHPTPSCPAKLQLQWSPTVVCVGATGNSAIELPLNQPESVTLLTTAMLDYHHHLSGTNQRSCIHLSVLTDASGTWNLLVLESNMLGSQQMLRVVRCATDISSRAVVTTSEWLAVESLARLILSSTATLPPAHLRVTCITNTITSPRQHPHNGPIRVMLHSWYSKRDCLVVHGVECSWDVWVQRDFIVALVQLPSEDSADDMPRRAAVTMLPRGDVGSNFFALHCAEWAPLSPRRDGPEDLEPCTVTLFVSHGNEGRALRFPALDGCPPTAALNVNGCDMVASPTFWTTLGLSTVSTAPAAAVEESASPPPGRASPPVTGVQSSVGYPHANDHGEHAQISTFLSDCALDKAHLALDMMLEQRASLHCLMSGTTTNLSDRVAQLEDELGAAITMLDSLKRRQLSLATRLDSRQ